MLNVSEAIGNDFIFYWVDGIYCKNTSENLSMVSSAFMDAGFTSKMEIVKKIEFFDDSFVVTSFVEEDAKRFSYHVGAGNDSKNRRMKRFLELNEVRNTINDVLKGKYDDLD